MKTPKFRRAYGSCPKQIPFQNFKKEWQFSSKQQRNSLCRLDCGHWVTGQDVGGGSRPEVRALISATNWNPSSRTAESFFLVHGGVPSRPEPGTYWGSVNDG